MGPKKSKKIIKQHVKVLAKIPISSKKISDDRSCVNPYLPEPCPSVQAPGCPISEKDGCKGSCETGGCKSSCETGGCVGCMSGCEFGGCKSYNMA